MKNTPLRKIQIMLWESEKEWFILKGDGKAYQGKLLLKNEWVLPVRKHHKVYLNWFHGQGMESWKEQLTERDRVKLSEMGCMV